jgi:hypothetical protein
METIWRLLAFITVTAMIVILSGCGGAVYVPINIRDSAAPVVSVKAQLLHQAEESETSNTTSHTGFEIQYIGMSGSDEQLLPEGQFMSVGDVTIMGPQNLVHNVDVSYAHIAYMGSIQLPESQTEMDVFMGVSRVSYRLNANVISPPPLMLITKDVDNALTMGLGLRWWIIEHFAAEGRLTIATQNPLSFLFDSFGKGDQTDLLEGEFALVYKPFNYAALRAGYAIMNLAPEKQSASSSFEFRLGGPFLGLVVLF